jgi:hypothetical protein
MAGSASTIASQDSGAAEWSLSCSRRVPPPASLRSTARKIESGVAFGVQSRPQQVNSTALLGVEVPADAWRHVGAATALRTLWQMRGIDVALSDRPPRRAAVGAAIADADGRLEAALTLARNRFVLVKPDR